MSLTMYAVVVFVETDEVELVASNWLQSQTKTFWPPYRNMSNVTKAVKDRVAADKTWPSYSIRILSACDSYEDGRRKLRMAEETSDIQTDDEVGMGKGARRRKERTLYSDTDDDGDDEAVAGPVKRKHLPPALPVPPFPSLHVPAGIQLDNRQATDREILKAISAVQVSLDEVRKEVLSQRQLLNMMISKEASSGTIDVMDTFPIKSMEELDGMENKIEDKEIAKSLVNQLSLIGGSNLKEATRRVMSQTISHNVALNLNWAGRKGWKGQQTEPKRAFGGLRLCAAMKKAMLKNVAFKTTEDQVEREMMIWLRNACDRHGGRKRRAESQATVSVVTVSENSKIAEITENEL
ncbi:uncharacterized protein LOC135477907 [Liolophura sinensis]|uniref:uncharacterized protein LOC135477907 n=1 Tax=Liolophura sinensis TaxID=3198878 RepID=UPI003158C459